MTGMQTLAVVAIAAAFSFAPSAHAQRGGGSAIDRPPMTGLWERDSSFRAGGNMTGYALSLKEGQTVFDDPEFYCEGYNVVRLTNTVNTPVRMTEDEDRLIIEYEGNAAKRVIFLDGRTPSENTGVIGNSVGTKLRDGTIEIRTDGFPEGLVHGVRATSLVTSAQLRYLERYRISPDGQAIEAFHMTVDSQALEYPRVTMGTWTRLPDDTYFQPYPCVIHEDEEIYTDEFRERALKMLEEKSDED